MPSSVNAALVRRAIETIWNRGDLDVADELFALEYVNHYGLIVDLVKGPEAVKISAAFHRLILPHLYVEVEDLRTDEDIVVLRWTARGGFGRIGIGSPTGGIGESLKGITRSRVAGGLIVESWTEWDQVAVLRDLGLVANRNQPKER